MLSRKFAFFESFLPPGPRKSIPAGIKRPHLQGNESSCRSTHALYSACSGLRLERFAEYRSSASRWHQDEETVCGVFDLLCTRLIYPFQFVCLGWKLKSIKQLEETNRVETSQSETLALVRGSRFSRLLVAFLAAVKKKVFPPNL